MKKHIFQKLPDKRKVSLIFTLSFLRLILWSSLVLFFSITTNCLSGKDKYIFFCYLYPAFEYILLSVVLATGSGFFLDYIFCKSEEL